ncbi:MAG: cytidylate kinase-like family protein [Gracilibacteraceae bacterium]|jgi:cytidylate kinase|nr:cytidylate kinase-like family protein [Gracilibacteraceae bacterium]
MQNYVITIARGFGSGGAQIARALSKELNIPFYENQILAMASEHSGISKEKFAQADEKLQGGLLQKLKAAPNTDRILLPADKHFVSDDNLFAIQAAVIRELAESESCIIVGKCANFLLRERSNVLSVYIEAPRAYCLKSVMEKMGISEEEAHALITKTDRYRSDYFQYYSGGRIWTDPVLYDLTLNTDRVGLDNAVALIMEYAKIKFGI